MTASRVSVVIDTYNYGRFVEDAVDSVLAQRLPKDEIEILVVDDGSTDDTAGRIAKYGDSVRYLRKHNGGQASAISFGIAHAQGEFVAFLDGDDVWMPDKLSAVLRQFEQDPQAVLVYHKFWFWDGKDQLRDSGWGIISGDILADVRKLVGYWGAPTSSLTFRRSTLRRIGPIPERCSFSHDTYLIATSLCIGPVAAVPEFLTKNRVHGNNLWFTDTERPVPETVRRRVQVGRAALSAARDWVQLNAPRSTRSRLRIFFTKWRVALDEDLSRIENPSRIDYFLYRCRLNSMRVPCITSGQSAYNWAHTFFELIVGRGHSHYLEGLRTRVRRLARWLRRPRRSTGQEV